VQVLPGQILLGVGLSLIFVPMQNLALAGIQSRDSGVAGAALTATQQIGGSVGTAVFTALYASAVGAVVGGIPDLGRLVDGYTAVFLAAAVGLFAAAPVAFFMVRVGKADLVASADPALHLG
jgi:hypothetical protein